MPAEEIHVGFSVLGSGDGDPGVTVVVESGTVLRLTQDLRLRRILIREGGQVVMNGYRLYGRLEIEP